jgi:hypothetical protein
MHTPGFYQKFSYLRWLITSLPCFPSCWTEKGRIVDAGVEYKAFEYPDISRGITVQEFLEAMDWAEKNGLTNLDPQSVAIRNFYYQRRSN